MSTRSAAIGILAVLAWFSGTDGQTQAQAHTITLRPRTASDLVNFGSPENAFDASGETSAGGGYLQHSCAEFCTQQGKSITATFHIPLEGRRPQRLEVIWQVRPVFSTWPADDGDVTATLELDVGNGWQPWEGEQFTWTKSSPVPGCPISTASNALPISCRTHSASRPLDPAQRTELIKVRATVATRMTRCSKCTDNSQAGVTMKVFDVRVIAVAAPGTFL
jgi:hypothetical protein